MSFFEPLHCSLFGQTRNIVMTDVARFTVLLRYIATGWQRGFGEFPKIKSAWRSRRRDGFGVENVYVPTDRKGGTHGTIFFEDGDVVQVHVWFKC
jgi:hypothetical protein